mmetsp:Transcript_7149/g.11215  ORF Transcript_7149/g.11215 Transcript_7149/m.11215 type:complete len:140 (-) Transcript_7149:386-805(-)
MKPFGIWRHYFVDRNLCLIGMLLDILLLLMQHFRCDFEKRDFEKHVAACWRSIASFTTYLVATRGLLMSLPAGLSTTKTSKIAPPRCRLTMTRVTVELMKTSSASIDFTLTWAPITTAIKRVKMFQSILTNVEILEGRS